MVFPYRIRIKDPEMIRVLKILQQKRAVNVNDGNLTRRIGKKVSPIRKEIYIGIDKRYKRSFVALSPNIKTIEIKPVKGFKTLSDVVFKWD